MAPEHLVGRDRLRVLLVGDAPGVNQALHALPEAALVGIVAASNRPQYHADLTEIAARQDVPLITQPPWQSPPYEAFVRQVEELRPELLLCNSYSMLVRPDVLALPSIGAVNVHAGKLPEYRGANPIQWQMIGGRREAVVTLHHLTPEIDAGDIVAERTVPIHLEDTWRAVSERVAGATDEMLADTLPAVFAGTAPRRPQDSATAHTWPRRQPSDGLIDWNRSVLQIHDLIRALGDGIPPAFYERHGEAIQLDRYLSLSEVVSLVYAPGPGSRRLARGDLSLLPAGGASIAFSVLRRRRVEGSCGVEPIDLDRRTGRAWADPPEEEALALVCDFAREELGFTVVEHP